MDLKEKQIERVNDKNDLVLEIEVLNFELHKARNKVKELSEILSPPTNNNEESKDESHISPL
jgi:hypothetical protein